MAFQKAKLNAMEKPCRSTKTFKNEEKNLYTCLLKKNLNYKIKLF